MTCKSNYLVSVTISCFVVKCAREQQLDRFITLFHWGSNFPNVNFKGHFLGQNLKQGSLV